MLELLPPLDAHKGTAVRALLDDRGLTRALFAGDDTTDLDAFEAVAGLEVGVKVAVASEEAPPELLARADLVVDGPGRPGRAAEDAVSGRPLPDRIRLGPVEVDRYLAGQLQGLAYMRRLRAIEDEEARHLRELDEAWRVLADEEPDEAAFALAWREVATAWDFRRINDLIAKHNAYYAIEARVPMNPRSGTYARSWQRVGVRRRRGSSSAFLARRARALQAAS